MSSQSSPNDSKRTIAHPTKIRKGCLILATPLPLLAAFFGIKEVLDILKLHPIDCTNVQCMCCCLQCDTYKLIQLKWFTARLHWSNLTNCFALETASSLFLSRLLNNREAVNSLYYFIWGPPGFHFLQESSNLSPDFSLKSVTKFNVIKMPGKCFLVLYKF